MRSASSETCVKGAFVRHSADEISPRSTNQEPHFRSPLQLLEQLSREHIYQRVKPLLGAISLALPSSVSPRPPIFRGPRSRRACCTCDQTTQYWDHTNPPHPHHTLYTFRLGCIKCNNLRNTHKTELVHCNLKLSYSIKIDLWGWGGFVWSPQ